MEPMGIERHRLASREAEMSGAKPVNTRLSRSAAVDSKHVLPPAEFTDAERL
jgi:hypothetical protein